MKKTRVKQIVIPFALTDLNTYIQAERSHRIKAAKLKKQMTNLVAVETQGFRITDLPSDFLFTWYVKPNRGQYKDPDNIGFAVKFIFDGMVKSGAIPNDTRKSVKGFRHAFIWDAEEDKCVITTEQ